MISLKNIEPNRYTTMFSLSEIHKHINIPIQKNGKLERAITNPYNGTETSNRKIL